MSTHLHSMNTIIGQPIRCIGSFNHSEELGGINSFNKVVHHFTETGHILTFVNPTLFINLSVICSRDSSRNVSAIIITRFVESQ